MKWFSCCMFVFAFFISLNCIAQTHFIYIQSDDKQPFSASVDNNIYNSSETGYIIIPKLSEGEHEIKITAATRRTPEQFFKILVGKRDAGYGLANDNAGLRLYNLRTKEAVGINSGNANAAAAGNAPVGNYNSSTFAQILSEVVNDPELAKKIDYSKTVVAKDIVYTNNADTIEPVTQSQPVLDDSAEAVENTAAADTRGIIKDNETDGTEGKEITFIEFNSAGNDTIHVTIPFGEMPAEANKNNETTANNNNNDNIKADSVTVKPEIHNNSVSNPFFNDDTAKKSADTVASNKAVITNNTCEKILSDDDLYKLKRKLFTEPDRDKMISIFKKNVKNKCVTTDQVKVLGSYFLSDESRFNFYSEAYAYVNDHGNYSTLENQLFDKSIRQQFHQLVSNGQN